MIAKYHYMVFYCRMIPVMADIDYMVIDICINNRE